jgi:hypothetical protein
VEAYQEALQAFHVAAGTVLFEFARDGEGYRNVIIRNFIARADMTARAIFQLWTMEDYQDCWVLHRCLLDRLFHLRYLNDSDGFDTFEAWSFLEQYKAMNRVRSDPEVQGAREHDLFNFTDEQKKRAGHLLDNPPQWRRPKPEVVAKDMDMRFLYVYGYDFASTHVHPMANDGDQDFHTITGLEPRPDYPDQRTVLANTLLVATLLVQEGLNASTLLWRQLVYGVFEDLRRFLDSGSTDYRQRLLTMVSAVQQGTVMCEPPGPKQGGGPV